MDFIIHSYPLIIPKENGITENNLKIEEYNSRVKDIIEKINFLEKWEDYVIFEGKKYGISFVYKGIHRENNCMGIIEKHHAPCECIECRGWIIGGCQNKESFPYYKCQKCQYKYVFSNNERLNIIQRHSFGPSVQKLDYPEYSTHGPLKKW